MVTILLACGAYTRPRFSAFADLENPPEVLLLNLQSITKAGCAVGTGCAWTLNTMIPISQSVGVCQGLRVHHLRIHRLV